MGLSLSLGWFATRITEATLQEEWEKTHQPRSRLVAKILQAERYLEVGDPEQMHRIMKVHPVHLDEPGVFWWTADLEWVLYFRPRIDASDNAVTHSEEPWSGEDAVEEMVLPMRVFQRAHASVPPAVAWLRGARGWLGLEQLLEQLRANPVPLNVLTHSLRPTPRVQRDPRQLHY